MLGLNLDGCNACSLRDTKPAAAFSPLSDFLWVRSHLYVIWAPAKGEAGQLGKRSQGEGGERKGGSSHKLVSWGFAEKRGRAASETLE